MPNIPKVGGKAAGGPVTANTPYVVGEIGPELFVPNTAGYIIPNNDLAGALSGNSGGSSAPVQYVNTQIIQSQADAAAMAMQLSFLRKAGQL